MSQLLLRVRLKATESLFWFSCTCENTLLHILPWRIQVSFHTHKSWKIAVLTLGRNYFIRFYCTTLFNCRLRLLWEKPPYTCIQTRLISPLVNSTWISAWWPIMCRCSPHALAPECPWTVASQAVHSCWRARTCLNVQWTYVNDWSWCPPSHRLAEQSQPTF